MLNWWIALKARPLAKPSNKLTVTELAALRVRKLGN